MQTIESAFQGCRNVDPRLVWQNCHRLWNSGFLELEVERDLVSKPGHSHQVDFSSLSTTIIFFFLRDLDAEGVKVTAYVTAHLNIDGDVYAEAAAVSSHFSILFPQITFKFSHSGGQLAEV